ncbi:mini-chromosome maintenance complex-binding protein [Fagus crenata]
MVGVAYDLLANPQGAVRSTFEKAVSSSGFNPASLNGKDWGALDLFHQFLFDQANLSQVPILNGETIKWVQPNTLVRFRGMIQDMLGNEFYVGVYKDGSVWRTNKFMDVSHFPMPYSSSSSSDMQVWERRLLYCVPVPGQNSWTEPSSESAMNRCVDCTSQQREKRRRMDDEPVDHMDMVVSDDGCQGSPCTKKMKEDGHPSMSSQTQEAINEGICSHMSVVPNTDRDSLPCLVKIYDSPESDLKLNDVFEFIGVLTFDSEVPVDKDDHDELSNGFSEDALAHLPPNKVPRLHCLIHRKLTVPDFLHSSPTMEPKPHLVKEIRAALLRHLTAVLGNDSFAAHFMLLHLLSRVHTRVDTLAVGKLSLNLTGFSKESVSLFGHRLSHAVKDLLPFTHCIPLTVEYLNSASLAPKKDYETNRLITGVLQLAEGSHLIIDETQLESGTLNSVGVENATLLKTLMELQKVEYDFKYYKMEMAADVQMLIISEGKSNILPADIVIPFQPSSVDSSEVVAAEALEAWRWYLATVKSLPHSIESEMQKVVEDDLVEARQTDRTIGSRDFNRWLTMGRLMCASFGETSLSLEHWQMVKELERLRRERLK